MQPEGWAPPEVREPVAPTRFGSWVGAGLAIGVLNLPKLGAGGKLVGEIRADGLWPIDLGVGYYFDNDAPFTRDELDLQAHPLIIETFPAGGSKLTFNTVQASAAVCPYERDLEPGSLLLCAGVQGGLLHVRASGLINERTSTHPLFDFEAYARWHFSLSPVVGVTYSAGLFVPLMRDRFGYLDRSAKFVEKFRVAAIGGRLDLLLTYQF